MRNLYASGGACNCSFCNRIIRENKIDVMGFQLHLLCAENVVNVLGKVRSFNEWKKHHPRERSFELLA
jgi:hypothetical protein